MATNEPIRKLIATASPNPARNDIRLQAVEKFDKVMLVNAEGSTVYDWKFSPTLQADLKVSDLPGGQYWLLLFGEQATGAVGIFLSGN